MTVPSPTDALAFAALLTPRGRGAVATIAVAGDTDSIGGRISHLFRAANRRPLSEQAIGRIVYGRWGDEPAEDIVVCRIDERTVEIHCHAGDAASRRILEHLAAAGFEIVSWNEWLRRRHGTLEAELAASLARATTERTAAILLEQSDGVLRSAFDELLSLAAAHGRLDREVRLREQIDRLLAWAAFGRHLAEPWTVVLAGRPNVGKSSLINALVGYERSIVFDQPGTTRDVVSVETALDGWPVRLSDTAGLRGEADALEAAGIQRAQAQLAAADCRVLLVDISQPPQPLDLELLSTVPGAIVVGHKADLPDVWREALPAEALRVSSVTRVGVDRLTRLIVERLVPTVPPSGTPIPVSERQVKLLQEARSVLDQGVGEACRKTLEALIH